MILLRAVLSTECGDSSLSLNTTSVVASVKPSANRLYRYSLLTLVSGLLGLSPVRGLPDEVAVIDAKADCVAGRCTFSATLKHADSGWKHYANHWRVLSPGGEELGKRVLLHPHENEQPFTRSLGNIKVPADLDHVIIEAHDSVHGYGGPTFKINILK